MLNAFAASRISWEKGRRGIDTIARNTKATVQTTPAPKAGRSTVKPAKSAPVKTLSERAPMVAKDELRAQVQKLEQTVATLRAKGREATRAAKISASRIAKLEDQVATLEKQVVSQQASAKRSATRSTARKNREIGPGDAVPPGVAVQEPEPMDKEAKTALENLEEHLGGRGE